MSSYLYGSYINEIKDNNDKKLDLLTESYSINLGGKGKRKLDSCLISIYGNEGDIPHFHIEVKEGYNKVTKCCVKLYECDYFHHKSSEIDLDKNQCEILDNFLSSGVWKNMDAIWYEHNKGARFENYCKTHNIDINNRVKPDYKKLYYNNK